MIQTAHVYLFDGYTDFEPAYVMTGLQNPQFQREPGHWQVRTVAVEAGQMVKSIGGLTVRADTSLQAVDEQGSALLILVGGQGWEDDERTHAQAVEVAARRLARGQPVAAICGATAGLARAGLLDARPHTSNAISYLKGTGYAGGEHYMDEPVVSAGGLITAGGMAALEFSRAIFELLGLYDAPVLEAWYQLYKTGKSEYFARMARAAEESAAPRSMP